MTRATRRRPPVRVVRSAAVLAVVLSAALAGAPTAARTTDGTSPHRSKLQRDADAIRAEGIVGVLAEVVTPHGRQAARSGLADLATRRPVPYNANLPIGSITKTFVATVVLQLAGEGRLSLDDTVERWLPGVVAGNGNDGRTITVRQLLQHTSGLYDYILDVISSIDTPEEYRRNRSHISTPRERVAIAMRHRPNFAPGTSWSYSNTNYILAGMLVERVTGRPWTRQVQERLIGPLRLRHTLTPAADASSSPRLAAPHTRLYQQFAPDGTLVDVTIPPMAIDGGADGSMISNTADLHKFFRALVGGALLRPEELAQMRRTVPATAWEELEPGARYGLGLIWRPLSCDGRGYWSHGGNGLGYTVENGITHDGRRGVVVSLSSRGVDPEADTRQRQATDALIEHALCPSNERAGTDPSNGGRPGQARPDRS
jgi:D-alanyl-D-alanine carboxypeptidase